MVEAEHLDTDDEPDSLAFYKYPDFDSIYRTDEEEEE